MKPAIEVAHAWLAKSGLGQTDECHPGWHGVDCNVIAVFVIEIRQEIIFDLAPVGHA